MFMKNNDFYIKFHESLWILMKIKDFLIKFHDKYDFQRFLFDFQTKPQKQPKKY